MGKHLGWYLAEQLVLKVTMAASRPAIWRRAEVHSGLTLHELHYVIQCVFADPGGVGRHDGPVQTAIANETATIVEGCVAALPRKQRIILVMRGLERHDLCRDRTDPGR